jgi:methionine synthase II (cobalamin-independent)
MSSAVAYAGSACCRYFADAAKAYRTELKLLYDMGCRNVQVCAMDARCLRA